MTLVVYVADYVCSVAGGLCRLRLCDTYDMGDVVGYVMAMLECEVAVGKKQGLPLRLVITVSM